MNWTVYREVADYDEYDYDDPFLRGWEDLSGLSRHRAYQVCDVTESENWLRSKYINIHDFREVEITIEIEYSFPDCTATGKNCFVQFIDWINGALEGTYCLRGLTLINHIIDI